MIFIKTHEKLFKLQILGYEFHNSEIAEDLNWLNIKIFVKDNSNEWCAEGAYLRTFDLQKLYSWIKGINLQEKVGQRLTFFEHELSFFFNDKQNELVINLDFNLHPKLNKYDYEKDSAYELSFNIEKINLTDVLKSISKLIEEFPIRFGTV